MTTPTDVDAPDQPGRRVPADRSRAPRRRGRRWIWIVALAAVLLLPILAVGGWYWYQTHPPGDPGPRVEVRIREGWGTGRIADELAARNVVGSALAFRLYTRVSGAGPFQAGTYPMRENMGSADAAATLERPAAQTYRELALIPGLTLEMIADRVGQLPGMDRDRFLQLATSGTIRSKFQPAGVNTLEGLTWPDTYYVSRSDTEESLLRTLVDHFDEEATKAGLATSPDPYRTLVIASLIQTEAKLDEDRPLIAAVVENRLRDGMQLQIDATLLYARGSRDGPITDEDYDRDSPYNTYRNTGLPPTPISTVTRPSIAAALRPPDVPYRFYVLIDENGKHKFAETFAEHERNIAEARRKGVL